MIPEEKQAGVACALRAAFGVSEFDEIERLTTGLSKALVFRIVVQGRPYLLRVIVSTSAAAGPGQGDQTRHFECMRKGAEAGIAPRVWYANAEDKISITDFLQARMFPRTEALARMPVTLRALHALPAFPRLGLVNYRDVMDGFVRQFQAAKILPESETEELCQGYAHLADVYPRQESEMVSCHNDLKPENILFDGNHVWLVDWEAAFLNDRYLDLAVVANFVVTNDAEEEIYLRTYFGEAPGEYRRAQFYLMRQMLHISAAVIFLRLGSGGKAIEANVEVPEFREFHERIWAGKIDLGDAARKVEYGMVHRNAVMENMRGVRFQEAMRTVSAGA